MFADHVQDVTVENRRRFELFRKGRVETVDESGDVPIVTVNGRRMPSTKSGLVVGDIVVYVDQADPFCVGNFAGT